MIRSVISCVAAVLLMGCLTPAARARTLEDILKDKGVITAEDYAEATRNPALAYYQPGKGMTIETADGNYKAQIGGYAQLIYRYSDYDDSARNNKSDFDIRRFKIQLKGHLVNRKFGYKFQGEMAGGFKTEDAYLNYKFGAPLVLQGGQFKPPQARQELTSASRQLFPDRSLANDTFNFGRDQGIQIAGSFKHKLLQYRVGVFNGNGPNISNPDNHLMYNGRIDINPLGSFKMNEAGFPPQKALLNLGASFSYNTVTGDDVGSNFDKDNDVLDKALNLDAMTKAEFTTAYGKDLKVQVMTANINYKWSALTMAGEYYAMNADPEIGEDWDADGYYLQAGYQVLPQTLEVGVRYAAIDSDSKTATRQVSAEFDKSETQVGVNYYFNKHLAKLQTDLTFVQDDLKNNGDDVVFRMQAQFYY
ncbi:hypothetical protein B5V00_07755 [Geothermobacter hydrogeniphilus]|uniref:Phosphate-selective porin OprO and OprP n=2 Tax=Geothermobacter hydrogeniphilus TaxID=1969733 RepID=A0A1X0Y5V1_9BACT|nr:hypothetical protein B5V00_07755 [Geothermobacter hydrogeniphilus]